MAYGICAARSLYKLRRKSSSLSGSFPGSAGRVKLTLSGKPPRSFLLVGIFRGAVGAMRRLGNSIFFLLYCRDTIVGTDCFNGFLGGGHRGGIIASYRVFTPTRPFVGLTY